MEIQNIMNPGKELKDNKPETLKDIVTGTDVFSNKSEIELPENMDFACVQLPENNDKAELSGKAETDIEDQEKAVKEIEKLLQQLAAWKPSVYGDAEMGLGRLKEMYMLILKQIVQVTEEKLQITLLDNLQMHMLEQIERYAVKNFGNLERLFRQYGGIADRAALINSLFKASVGRALPPDRISKFLEVYSKNYIFESGSRTDASVRRNMMGGRTAAVMESRSEGILYQKQPSNSLAVKGAFSSRKLIEADYLEGGCPADRKEAKFSETFSGNSPKNGGIYHMDDIKITEQFLKGLLGDGDLLRNTGITACNPQMKGYLAAATWLKADLFLQTSGIQKGLTGSLVQAIDKMVHTYIAAVTGRERPATLTELPKNAILREDNKDWTVYNVYYQIRLLCQKERDKGKALSLGLRYAHTEFMKEKDNEGFFFGQLVQGEDDFKKGFLILKENWKRFVNQLPVSNHKKKELEASFLSPWGDYVSPLIPLYHPELGSRFIIGGAALIGIIVLISMFS